MARSAISFRMLNGRLSSRSALNTCVFDQIVKKRFETRERDGYLCSIVSSCDHLKHKDLKKDIKRTICDARGFDLSYCFQRNSVDIFSVCGFKILKNRKKTALVEFSIFDVM